METFKVYEAIANVSAELAKEGISKNNRNQQQGYSFRGIDDVYNALAPIIAKNKLCILPRITERELVERQNSKGNALFYVTVKASFDFVSAEDGSRHTVETYGEAMDSGDKATNKAMSAAYKYACMQAFCIPTEGDNDSDATTHEVKHEPKHASKNEAARATYSALEKSMRENKSTRDLAAWWKDQECIDKRKSLPDDWQGTLHEEFKKLGFELKAKEEKAKPAEQQILDDFPGSRVVNETVREQSTLEAG